MVLYRYRHNMPFKLNIKKTRKNLVKKYPEIRSYVSKIPWSYKKNIVNRPVLYTRHFGTLLS